MPEGDSIHRIANRLAPRLVGKSLERVTTQGLVRGLAGRTVTSVLAHGKHLVIELDNGTQLRAHLGMNGRQRSYSRVEGDAMLAKMSPGRATLAITTADTVDIWIGAPTIEISDRRAPRHGMAVAQLGADVLAPDFDHAAAAQRAAESNRPIGIVVMDQRIAAGIGNVYKSEILFACGVEPRTPASAISRETLAAIYEQAHELMLRNLGAGPRTTRESLAGDAPNDERYFVYGRTNKPCRACQTPIVCYALGEPPRWTWSCPTCQVPPPNTSGAKS